MPILGQLTYLTVWVESIHPWNSEKCHTTYTTDFEPQQEEECDETFIKSCFIEYKKKAEEETIQFCHTPLICEGEGEEECKTVYESQCETRFHEHEVEDDVVECEETFEEKCVDETQGNFLAFFGPFLALFGNNYFKLNYVVDCEDTLKRNDVTKVRKDLPYIRSAYLLYLFWPTH